MKLLTAYRSLLTPRKPTHWQLVFASSRANGADENMLSAERSAQGEFHWHWPADTWFRRRLALVRRSEGKS
jgi:hypothetical protein